MKRHFSLLEVLVALLLITTSLPLLLAPFIYATTDQMETVQKLRKEKSALYYLVMVLGDLHTGTIPLSQLDAEQAYPFKPEWKDAPGSTGTYKFKKIRDKPISESQSVELWQVTFEIAESSFSYDFIVRRGKAAEQPKEAPSEP